MTSRRVAPILFLVASGLFFAGALRDLFLPTLLAHGNGRPALSASLAVVFLIVGLNGRSRTRRSGGPADN